MKGIFEHWPNRITAIRFAGSLVLFVLFLSSCSLAVSRQTPPLQTQGGFSANGQKVLPARWWQTFDDPTLNRLVEQALAENFSLQSAWDRLERARAVARKAGAGLIPQFDGEAGFTASRSRVNSVTNS